MDKRPILVVAPHGLDEVLGVGGTIAVHAGAGHKVHVLILCGDGQGLDGRRREAAGQAAKLLGAEPPVFAGFPENRSDSVPLSDVVAVIEAVVADVKPAIVYVSHGGNLNIDHQTAYRATATALRPAPTCPVTEFYAYEIASSTDWAPASFGAGFKPNHFVDIASVLARKLKALELYAFDMRAEPHARSIQALEALARSRGAGIGVAAVEAFTTERTIVRADR